MIVVQDRIDVFAADLERLQKLFEQRYRSAAAVRGLTLIETLVSPPLKLADQPSTLWLRWQVSDAGAWWAMRAQSGTAEVAAFWAEVDSFCLARKRNYLSADTGALPAPEDISAFGVQIRGYRETAQLALRDGISAEQRAVFEQALQRAGQALPGLEYACISANLAPEYAAGDYTWDLLFADQQAAEAARNSDIWKTEVAPALKQYCRACHALSMDTLGAGLRDPDLRNGIKRTAFFRLLPGTSADTAKRFERDLLEMPGQIPAIRNWRLSRAQALPWNNAAVEPWTYVWEQEFENLEGLTGPYMVHPHHWAHIDRWFDPESGAQAVDVNLSHAFSVLPDSILTREAAKA